MGEIRRLKHGPYQADVYNALGNRIRRNFQKKTDAQAFITMIEKEKYDVKLNSLNIIRKRKSMIEAIEDARASKESLSKNSIKKYRNVYHQFEIFILNNNIQYADEFTSEHATELSNLLKTSGAASKTVNFYLMTIKALFQDLCNMDFLQRNPFAHIKNVKPPIKTIKQKEEEYYTEDEIKVILSLDIEPEYKEAITTLYLTGMRFEELSSLKWENVDLENKLIKIRTEGAFKTKTASSERDIPVSEVLYDILKSKTETCEYVFPSRVGKKLSERTLLQVIKRSAENAGLTKNATLHKLRHSFNSHLTINGVSFEIRQYLLGHKPQTMTDRYTKLDPAKMHEHLACLDKVVSSILTAK